MRGSIRERSPGRWELRVYVGRHPVSGNPRQISRMFEGSRRNADQALRRLVAEVEEGEVTAKEVVDPGHTVAVLFERFFRMKPLAESTARSYRSYANHHILPAIGHLQVRDVTTANLNEVYGYLREVDKLAPATVRHVHSVLSAAFEFGIDETYGGLTVNPCRRAMLPKVDRDPIIPPSREQVARMLDPTIHSDPEFLLACRLAVATGARRGEICGLRWFDLGDNRQLHIARSVWDAGNGRLVVKTPKSGRGRRIALDEQTWNLLAEIRMDPSLNPRSFILSGEEQPCSPEMVTLKWQRLCERLGVTGFRFHDLRHFHATELLRSGKVSIADVSRRLGHSKTSITLDIYAHAIPEDDHHAAEVISDLMGFRQLDRPGPSEPVRFIPRGPVGGD